MVGGTVIRRFSHQRVVDVDVWTRWTEIYLSGGHTAPCTYRALACIDEGSPRRHVMCTNHDGEVLCTVCARSVGTCFQLFTCRQAKTSYEP